MSSRSARFQWYPDLDVSAIPPRSNAAPTRLLPVIVKRDEQRHQEVMPWGLVPS